MSGYIDKFFNKVRPKHEAEPRGAHKSETIHAVERHIEATMDAFRQIHTFERLLETPFVEPVADVHCSVLFDILNQYRVQIVYVIGETEPMCARIVEADK